jgi:hypothetical protein
MEPKEINVKITTVNHNLRKNLEAFIEHLKKEYDRLTKEGYWNMSVYLESHCDGIDLNIRGCRLENEEEMKTRHREQLENLKKSFKIQEAKMNQVKKEMKSLTEQLNELTQLSEESEGYEELKKLSELEEEDVKTYITN